MSTLSVSNVSDGTTTVGTGFVVNGSAKAWTLFNQATPAITDSLNTSSLTDTSNGQGDLNWTNAMDNATYAASGTAPVASSTNPYVTATMDDTAQSDHRTASKWYFQCVYANASSAGYFDGTVQSASIFGDLA